MCYVNQFLITSVLLVRLELCKGTHTPVGTRSSNEFRAQDIDIFYRELKPWREEFLGYNPTKLRFALNSESNSMSYLLKEKKLSCSSILMFQTQEKVISSSAGCYNLCNFNIKSKTLRGILTT